MDATDIWADLVAGCIARLQAAGHRCDMLPRARYDAASGTAVCGCGVFEEYQPPEGGTEVVRRQAGTMAYEARDPIESTLALIDPAEQYTPDDVERHILDVLSRLETGALFERQTVLDHFKAKQAFDLAYNARLLASEQRSADLRKADAMTHCADLYRALGEAEMLKDAAKATMHNLRAILSGYQSTARSVGATFNAGGAQQAHTRTYQER
jgi:hypothetical protein